MIRVSQSANRLPKPTETSPPAIAGRLSDSGWPEASTSRQTTSMVSATAAATASARRRWRKICGYMTSSSEKYTGWRPASTNHSVNRPVRYTRTSPARLLVEAKAPEPQLPASGEHGHTGHRPPVGGGGRVEQGQDRGQGEGAVEGGVPDPGVLDDRFQGVWALLAPGGPRCQR